MIILNILIDDVDYINKDHYIVHSGGIVYVDGVNSNQPAGFASGNTKLVSTTVELYHLSERYNGLY